MTPGAKVRVVGADGARFPGTVRSYEPLATPNLCDDCAGRDIAGLVASARGLTLDDLLAGKVGTTREPLDGGAS